MGMSKKAIREFLTDKQNNRCVLCGAEFGDRLELYDIMRKIPSSAGGGYKLENLQLVHPICRMKHQGSYRWSYGPSNLGGEKQTSQLV